jgi:hypothetical protein
VKKSSFRLLLLSLVVGTPALLAASDSHSQRTCSTLTLHGSYAYSADGYIIQPLGDSPLTPIAEAGRYQFDGRGGFTNTNTLSFGGTIIPRAATGSYTVNDDCTGSADINGGVSFHFAITRAAKSIHFVVSTPNVAVAGTMEKQ